MSPAAAAPVRVAHYSDVLCVWAYVTQVRMDELETSFGRQVDVEWRFVSVFGEARAKLEKRWRDRGGLAAYAEHVLGVAAQFPHVTLHPEVWRSCAPQSSHGCHAFLCAVRVLEGEALPPGSFGRAALALREAFFCRARDVGTRAEQLAVAEGLGFAVAPIEAALDDGRAFAELGHDYDLARELSLSVSPTVLLNDGRQRLTGNVSYRILEANVRELLHRPSTHEASWC